jgi:hypothetical protein
MENQTKKKIFLFSRKIRLIPGFEREILTTSSIYSVFNSPEIKYAIISNLNQVFFV